MLPRTLRLNASLAVADGPITWGRFVRDVGLSDDALRARLSELRGIVEARLCGDVLVVYGRIGRDLHAARSWPASSTIDAFVGREIRLAKKRASDAASDARKREAA